ncbi:MAG: hypothetical protein EZS28_018888 [Streblomastix strix]|uniref:Tyr recombinase domain-containing protein n=1 Tax=Streblomastix strix TaxID=222440 RepID=A0A5J4VSK5_9EUKA|nr:MAG: hypothetical protein EZS28_018888 [Streblomastix strix]
MKDNKVRNEKITLFQRNSQLCPVLALKNWMKTRSKLEIKGDILFWNFDKQVPGSSYRCSRKLTGILRNSGINPPYNGPSIRHASMTKLRSSVASVTIILISKIIRAQMLMMEAKLILAFKHGEQFHASRSLEENQSMIDDASGDVEIQMDAFQLRRRDHNEMEEWTDNESIPPSDSEETRGIQRRRLNKEDEITASESLSQQDPDIKSIIKKTCTITSQLKKYYKKAALRLIESRTHQK